MNAALSPRDALPQKQAHSPQAESLAYAVVVVFAKTRSHVYGPALLAAQAAEKFVTDTLQGCQYHAAYFAKTPEQVARAQSVIGLMGHLPSTQVFSGGRRLDNPRLALPVLGCYLQACQCNDWRAHCLVPAVIYQEDDLDCSVTLSGITFAGMPEQPPRRRPVEYLVPCRHIGPLAYRLQHKHPATLPDQLQALAVREGCDWCPNFNPTLESI